MMQSEVTTKVSKKCSRSKKKCRKTQRKNRDKCLKHSQASQLDQQIQVYTVPKIVSFKQAPSFQVDNEYIKNGYRINYSSFSRLIWSLFELHNESANVWSHLIGMMIFIFILVSKTNLE